MSTTISAIASTTKTSSEKKSIGIIAGGGALPSAVAEAAIQDGHDVHILGLVGEAGKEIEAFPHSWFKWGEFGRLFKILAREECRYVVIIGSVSRPDLTQIHIDFGAIKTLPFLFSLTFGGDDSILSRIVNFFEDKGHIIVGAGDVAPKLLAPAGQFGKYKPSDRDLKDIELGFDVVHQLGMLDVGQASVVAKGYVIAVEAAEGTDDMLKRSANLRQWGKSRLFGSAKRAGVLVKRPKPGQEMRVDMPTIGPRTVELAGAAGLAGIAIEAGSVLLAEKEKLIACADKLGLFLVGLEKS